MRLPAFTLKTATAYLFHIAWTAFATALFVLYSGRISHIYGSTLDTIPDLPTRFLQIDIAYFIKNSLFAFIGMLCFTLSCILLGSAFIKRHYPKERLSLTTWLAMLITAFLLGEIIYSLFFLGTAILGKFSPPNTLITIILGGLIGIISVGNLIDSYRDANKDRANGSTSKYEDMLLWASIIVILSTVLLTSARLSYDSVALYFVNAKITAMAQRIEFFPNDSFVVSSFHTGVLYSAIIQLFGDQAARLFSWINGVFIVILCMGLAEQVALSRTGKVITLVLLATSTAFLDLFGDGKIELTATLPALAAVYWLINANKSRRTGDYLFVGIFSGFAMIARPYNAILLGGFIGIYYIASKESAISRVKSFLLIACPIAIFLGLHIIANWLILGDPLAPINNTLKVNKDVWQWSFDPEQIWAIRVFYPLVATFINTAQSLGNISPLLIMFLPVFFLKQLRANISLGEELRKISIIASLVLGVWIMTFFTVLEIRYVLFLWMIIYLAIADAISSSLEHMHPVYKKTSQGIFIILLLFMLVRNVFMAVDAYAPVDKNNIPQCGDFIFCNFLAPVNEMAKPGERVLTLNAYRYYLRPELFACSSKNTEYAEIRDASLFSNDAFWLEAHRQGYTYITYERNYAVRHLYMDFFPDPENTPTWLRLERLKGEEDDSNVSYKIHYIDPPHQMEKICLQNDGVWLVQEVPQ